VARTWIPVPSTEYSHDWDFVILFLCSSCSINTTRLLTLCVSSNNAGRAISWTYEYRSSAKFIQMLLRISNDAFRKFWLWSRRGGRWRIHLWMYMRIWNAIVSTKCQVPTGNGFFLLCDTPSVWLTLSTASLQHCNHVTDAIFSRAYLNARDRYLHFIWKIENIMLRTQVLLIEVVKDKSPPSWRSISFLQLLFFLYCPFGDPSPSTAPKYRIASLCPTDSHNCFSNWIHNWFWSLVFGSSLTLVFSCCFCCS
jgi:hypothetical protein